MPFKMMGKSPLIKKLVGKQGKLPENLKAAIKAAPGPSPATMVSPLKETEYQKTLKAARAAGMSQFDYNKKMKADKAAANQGRTEGSGAATANQNAGQTFQDLQKKVAGMSQAQKDSIKKAQNQMSGKEKKPTVNVPERKGVKVNKEAAELNKIRSEAETAEAAYKASQPKVPETIKKVDTSPKKSEFGKKAINRSGSFTDEYGNTYDRDVKGRKKADGSVSKTISNKTNDVTTREKDVTKGPKVKGKRKDKTVTKTKFDREGEVKKVVTKTRGKKREVSSDSDAKEKREKILADRKRRDESPTKMVKSPAKNYKKGYYK
jgi:hypothetical protein